MYGINTMCIGIDISAFYGNFSRTAYNIIATTTTNGSRSAVGHNGKRTSINGDFTVFVISSSNKHWKYHVVLRSFSPDMFALYGPTSKNSGSIETKAIFFVTMSTNIVQLVYSSIIIRIIVKFLVQNGHGQRTCIHSIAVIACDVQLTATFSRIVQIVYVP